MELVEEPALNHFIPKGVCFRGVVTQVLHTRELDMHLHRVDDFAIGCSLMWADDRGPDVAVAALDFKARLLCCERLVNIKYE